MSADPHESLAPSAWVVRWAGHVPAGGRVLDLACGAGRHSRFFAARGHRVEAVDRDPGLLANLAGVEGVTTLSADLEGGPWPFGGVEFEGIVVTNYLHRPLFPHLLAALAAGGVLIYETFAAGNERYGRPSNPAFLLAPGELLDVVYTRAGNGPLPAESFGSFPFPPAAPRGKLRVIAYEDLFVKEPKPAMVQRICAVRSDQ